MSLQNSHQISDVKIMLKEGQKGTGIASIEKTSTSGVVDTYTITYEDGRKSTFNVTNGSSIASIVKTGTQGHVDTYTITLTDGSTSTFEVTNGNGMGSKISVLLRPYAEGDPDAQWAHNYYFVNPVQLKKGNQVIAEVNFSQRPNPPLGHECDGVATFSYIEEVGTFTVCAECRDAKDPTWSQVIEQEISAPYFGAYEALLQPTTMFVYAVIHHPSGSFITINDSAKFLYSRNTPESGVLTVPLAYEPTSETPRFIWVFWNGTRKDFTITENGQEIVADFR